MIVAVLLKADKMSVKILKILNRNEAIKSHNDCPQLEIVCLHIRLAFWDRLSRSQGTE